MTGVERLEAILTQRLAGLGLGSTEIVGLSRAILDDLRSGDPRCIVVQQVAIQRLEDSQKALRSQLTALGEQPCA